MGDARPHWRHRRGRLAGFDEAVAKAEEIVVPVQINGKVRARLTVAADIAEEQLRELALADPQVVEASRGQDGPEGRGRRWRRVSSASS